MARPRLEQESKLTKRVTFRLAAEEFGTLNQLAELCGVAVGSLVREKLFTGKYPQARTPRIYLHTYTELKKIGVNLNQLTRLANAGRLPFNLLEILTRLEAQQETIIASLLYDSHTEDR